MNRSSFQKFLELGKASTFPGQDQNTGFWLLHKRLEKGTFAWPIASDDTSKQIEMSASDLAALLGGLDVQGTKRRRWYSRSG